MKKLLSLLSVLGLLFACTPEENNPGGNDVNGNKVAATAISLNKAEVTLERGATVDLTVNATPVNADDLKIEWSSSNPSVASVDNGKITAIAAGTAEITAKCGELTAKCAVTVIVSATSIKLNKASIELEQGQSETLTATLEPADATDEIVWQSSDKFIAVVESGVVAAVGLGNATITASAGTLSTTCEVVVKALFIPEAIDLGLSVKWAKCNLGAEKPEGYGDYYAWGETEPYYSSQNPLTWKDGKSAGYIWASYRWCNGAYDKLTRYCPEGKANYWDGTDTPDNKTEFADYNYADDAARARLGGKWRMPTDAEWTELRTKCYLSNNICYSSFHWRRKWQPTPLFLPGECQGQRSLVGCRLLGRTGLDMTEAT